MLKFQDHQDYIIYPELGEFLLIKRSKAMDGRFFFRKKKRIENFDRLRNRPYIDDYGQVDDNRYFFRFLNGLEEVLTAKEIEEYYDEV